MRHEPVILIVDSQELYDAMAPVLSRELVTTHLLHRDSLESALELLDSDARIDLIFADWDLTGPDFVDAVRRHRETRHTPLVVTTEHDTDFVIASAMRRGASDLLAKPFLDKGLMHKVNRILKTQERRRKRRLHPDHDFTIKVDLQQAGKLSLQLVDFSLEGCMTRGTNELCERMRMGDTGVAHLLIDNFDVDLECRLFRIEEATPEQHDAGGILLTFRFVDSHEERVEKLEQLLDEYAAIW